MEREADDVSEKSIDLRTRTIKWVTAEVRGDPQDTEVSRFVTVPLGNSAYSTTKIRLPAVISDTISTTLHFRFLLRDFIWSGVRSVLKSRKIIEYLLGSQYC